jgi:hypothetical protein
VCRVLHLLSSETKLRGRVLHGEDNKLALEENVTEDGDAGARAGLDTSVALRAGDLGVVDVAAGDGELLATNDSRETGESGRAREDVTTLAVRVLGTRDLCVVGVDNVVGKEHKGGAGVSNSRVGAGDGGAATDSVAGGGELPEAACGVDVDIGDGTSVLRAVNVTEVVRSGATLLQVDSEELAGKSALDRVKEGGLLIRADGVDGREGKSEKTVVVSILLELSGDGGGGLNSLRGGGDTTNNDLVGVDQTGSTGAITVADAPGLAIELAARGGIVDGVTRSLRGRLESGEDPEIGGTGVEVEVHGSTTDRDRAKVLRVAVVRVGSDGAALLSSCGSLLDNSGRSTAVLLDSLGEGKRRGGDLGVASGNLRNRELDVADAASGLNGRGNSDSCNCSKSSESLLHDGEWKR